ncbi:hypothetical protein HKX48_008050 [Thoreauomyces humboldtii]|nr:hypothetical protein HKX48_008050 [Thoreauomyces humboldtii]
MLAADGAHVKTLLQESHADSCKTPLWGLAPHPKIPTSLLTAGDDGYVRLWNTETRLLVSKRKLGAKLRCCAWEPMGKQIAVGTDDGTIHIITSDILGSISTITQRRDTIHDLKYSPNGRHLAAATHEAVIDIYAVEGAEGTIYQRIMCCRGHSSFVLAVDWSLDSLRLQSNSGNNEIMDHGVTASTASDAVLGCGMGNNIMSPNLGYEGCL